MQASDVMQKGVISVNPELGVGAFEEFLTAEEISGAPVVDENGRLVGIASKTDIVRSLSEEMAQYIRELEQTELRVEDIMTTRVVSVGPDEDVHSVAKTMVDGHLHRVIVVDGDEMLGIITAFDLLKRLI